MTPGSGFTTDVLNLRAAPQPQHCALEPLLYKLLELVAAAARNAGPPEQAAARERFQQLCDALRGRPDRQLALDLTDEIVSLCSTLLESSVPVKSAARELAAALTLIREAVASMSADERDLGRSLDESASRFEALRLTGDIQQLRAGLAREVAALRAVAAEREAQWRRRVQHVEQKLAVLEDQLAETQIEAMHDPVTGLVNRRWVEKSFATFQATRRQFVLALLDIDDFKEINDTFGHLVGDAALQAVATALQAAFRTRDVVGRFGGDEFIVLLADLTLPQAQRRFQSVIRDLQSVSFCPEQRQPLGMSCGITEYAAGDTFAGLIKRADGALYDAKRAGKNRVAIRNAPFIRDLKRR